MTNKELQKLAEEYAQNHIDAFSLKIDGDDAEKAMKELIMRHFMAGAESLINTLGVEIENEPFNSTTLNVRLDIVSNGAIFTDLKCDDKYLGTEVFFNESDKDVAIYEKLGGWLYTELENKGLAGKNIELSIKVKEV
jgi:hypothetical protein